MMKRPVGLTVFAVINFFFATGVLVVAATNIVRETDGLLSSVYYAILSPLITITLLVISGVGFLERNYHTGYICGIVFCVFALSNIFGYGVLSGFENFALEIPSMIYPTLLLLMLTLRYRLDFP